MLSLEYLPCEMLFHIFGFLTNKELCNVRCLGQMYKNIVDTPNFYSNNDFRIKLIWQDYIKIKTEYEDQQKKIEKFDQKKERYHKDLEKKRHSFSDNICYFLSKINISSCFNSRSCNFLVRISEFECLNKKINKIERKLAVFNERLEKYKTKVYLLHREHVYRKYGQPKNPPENNYKPTEVSLMMRIFDQSLMLEYWHHRFLLTAGVDIMNINCYRHEFLCRGFS